MTARKRKHAREQEVTAQPRPLSQELPKQVVPEEGLSVDPEDLAIEFLRNATEQGNFESAEGQASELSIVEGAPTDEALTGPNFDPDHEIWEQTVDQALQHGSTDAAGADASRGGADLDEGVRVVDARIDQHIDLSEEAVHDASLLDEEGDELGETREPDLNTDDGARPSRK